MVHARRKTACLPRQGNRECLDVRAGVGHYQAAKLRCNAEVAAWTVHQHRRSRGQAPPTNAGRSPGHARPINGVLRPRLQSESGALRLNTLALTYTTARSARAVRLSDVRTWCRLDPVPLLRRGHPSSQSPSRPPMPIGLGPGSSKEARFAAKLRTLCRGSLCT